MAHKPRWVIKIVDNEERIVFIHDTTNAHAPLKGGRIARVSKEDYKRWLQIERKYQLTRYQIWTTYVALFASWLGGLVLVFLTMAKGNGSGLLVLLAAGSLMAILILILLVTKWANRAYEIQENKKRPLIASSNLSIDNVTMDPMAAQNYHDGLLLIDQNNGRKIVNSEQHAKALATL